MAVLDGDTGRAVAGARVEAPGAHGRRAVLVTRIRARPLEVTATAPGYGSVTRRLAPGARKLTVELYRTAGQWLLYGASASRAQYQPAIHLRPPFRVVWSRYLGTLLEFPAVVDDGVAYLSNLHGQLYALSMSDGHIVWQLDMHTREEDSSPAVVGSELVAHVKAGRVLLLDRASGRILWSHDVSGEIESSPVVEDGIDYLGDWAGDVYALDLATKKVRWTYHDGCKITASVAIVGRALYLGDYCGRVLALDKQTGRVLWTASAESPVYGTSAVAGGRRLRPVPRRGRALRLHHQRAVPLARLHRRPRLLGRPRSGADASTSAPTPAGCTASPRRPGPSSGRSTPEARSPARRPSSTASSTRAPSPTGSSVPTLAAASCSSASRTASTSPCRGTPGRLLLYGWASVWAVEPRS